MATQAALIADTIVGMKRALRRERDESGPDDPITQPTNRGNKMHANAKYVSEGALGYINAEEFYKEKVDHAGYTRYILNRNPVRYDSEGDELDEEDEDSEADAAAAEENPFSGIALETLLCPLKHPSELPTHPSMSQPYTSEALEQMTLAVEEKLRQERALLWRARNLHRQFLGDGGWIPCGVVETADDRYIFQPRGADRIASTKQKRQNGAEATYGNGGISAQQDSASGEAQNSTSVSQMTNNDVEMAEIPLASAEVPSNTDTQEPLNVLKSEEADATVAGLPQHPAGVEEASEGAASLTDAREKREEMDTTNGTNKTDTETMNTETNGVQSLETEQDEEMHDGSSPEPPRRMTTRAQANATNPGDGSPISSTGTLGTFPAPHPLFLMPENVRPDANFGLPPAEAEETRRLLWSYIQKQEETVRGFEHMLNSLLRAFRMRSDVLEWCKAEGHVGEMSDGEDWYDREKWGLAENEDLKKGTDEDEIETVDDTRTTAKRGRGRRQ
ncbi:uncharacterized protein N7469_006766 [Penicillium citrinum]|uniref:Transcriptional regulatory protein RXT2 N-terminal domain-containing protein n=2 Tax=Penicillium TaxID=5073 RepID=A0A9W9TMP7_PENCI|nr:uncharacterized protein N7469_006766 [Penicillium citrinum]KAJ5226760.1 hypothetical protein N7469_006766 [Penicillium citrinum]KAK5791059.1 hypothetical protein VI817_006368 [Penicillium citrinum]